MLFFFWKNQPLINEKPFMGRPYCHDKRAFRYQRMDNYLRYFQLVEKPDLNGSSRAGGILTLLI